MTDPIYTRGGDAGETSLADGARVPKDHPRVVAYGTVDEANSQIGLTLSATDDARLSELLAFVQQRLLNCAGNLATPAAAVTETTPEITQADVEALERSIDRMTKVTGDLDRFILPGGCDVAARLHVARTVTRRAERHVARLARDEPVDANVLAFLNRLSDALFVAARYANQIEGSGDVAWDPDADRPQDVD